MRLMRKLIVAAILALGMNHAALAQTCPSSPYTLTNGTNADASQVMANFNNLLNCINSQPGLVFAPAGRLTLSIGTPVLTSAVNGGGTVYYTPYTGNLVPIWSGTGFVARTFTELSNVLANSTAGNAGPAAATAGAVYDLFVWSNAGTITLTRGPAWTNTTTRSAALTRVNGLLTNSTAIANGPAVGFGTYIGTIATDNGSATVSFNSGSSISGGGPSNIGLWNQFNRVRIIASVNDASISHTYASATYRSFNGSNGNRVTFVTGQAEDSFTATAIALIQTSVGGVGSLAFGLDNNNAISTGSSTSFVGIGGSQSSVQSPIYFSGNPIVGQHYIQLLQKGDGTTATTFLSGPYELLQADLRY
ncbi:hypothetical protein J2Y55_003203 [Bosea sp. BE125]|uniref:hypothetical protein n=1 Tax=Bosea sp. BE125 TaxID=2817909 RepID=UPI002865261F|nr:hypothetical protein [Bosea sp. BE125]MDR6872187.1 hypothetical protein [Bosea sp. BE125]